MNKIRGYQIEYKLKPGKSATFNQVAFGRITTAKKYGDAACYYIPGVFDNIPHQKTIDGRIFVASVAGIDFDPLLKFCRAFDISTTDKEDKYIFLQTGRDKWKFRASERGVKLANDN